MRSPIGDDPYFCIRTLENLRARHKRACALELAVEPLHIVFVIVGALAVVRFIVVAAATRKVRCSRMIRSRQRAVSYAIAVQIFISGKAAELIEICLAENLAPLDRRSRI